MFDIHLDTMSILIEKDKESDDYVDYFFMCDVSEKDPRYKGQFMRTGQRRGLFRIQKGHLDTELIFPMEFDVDGRCFSCAAHKVKSIYMTEKKFPDKAQFASG